VRVGDKMSVFTPELTNAVSVLAAAYQKEKPAFKFQRKLMAGGTCEASAFSVYGIASTCLCLPLGNYHNMADIDGVTAGKKKGRVGQEYVAAADFHGLVELLGVIARRLDAPAPSRRAYMEKIWAEHGKLLARK
jgi:endoglucanase